MPLSTYQQAKAYGKMIEYVTANKLMPPSKADESFSKLKNHNTLTEAELDIIKNWVSNAMPEGKEPETTNIKHQTSITKPDMVIAMQKSFTIRGDYKERLQVFVIPVKLAKDTFIDAIEFVPGNTKVVKSCSISIDTGQLSTRYDDNDLNYGYSSITGVNFIPYQYNWYQWTADEQTAFYPKPYAKKLPAGSKLLLQVTYVATTRAHQDSSYVKFRFAKKDSTTKVIRSEVLLDTTHITNRPFTINAGDKKRFYAIHQLKQPTEIHSVMPMGQAALSSWEIYAVDSLTGRRSNLLKIPYWDAHWKKKYSLETPVQLSAGSKIFGVAYYNNTDGNTNLVILPPKKIKYGEGRRDELFAVSFDVVYKDEKNK